MRLASSPTVMASGMTTSRASLGAACWVRPIFLSRRRRMAASDGPRSRSDSVVARGDRQASAGKSVLVTGATNRPLRRGAGTARIFGFHRPAAGGRYGAGAAAIGLGRGRGRHVRDRRGTTAAAKAAGTPIGRTGSGRTAVGRPTRATVGARTAGTAIGTGRSRTAGIDARTGGSAGTGFGCGLGRTFGLDGGGAGIGAGVLRSSFGGAMRHRLWRPLRGSRGGARLPRRGALRLPGRGDYLRPGGRRPRAARERERRLRPPRDRPNAARGPAAYAADGDHRAPAAATAAAVSTGRNWWWRDAAARRSRYASARRDSCARRRRWCDRRATCLDVRPQPDPASGSGSSCGHRLASCRRCQP